LEQIPRSEANHHSASQEIPRLLWNPKVHYLVHTILPLVSVLKQIHPVHIFPTYYPKIRSNVILPSTPRSSEVSLPLRSSNEDFTVQTTLVAFINHGISPHVLS